MFCVFRPVGNAAPLAGPMRATNDLEFAISAGTAITKWVSYEGTSGRRWLDCTSKSALGVAGSVGSQRFDFGAWRNYNDVSVPAPTRKELLDAYDGTGNGDTARPPLTLDWRTEYPRVISSA